MIKKIFALCLCFVVISQPCYGAYEWRKGTGENVILGTENPSDIDTVSYQNIVAPVDRLLSNYRNGCAVVYVSSATLSVGAGEVMCSNAAGSIRKMRQNTSATSVSWSDIDTGAEAVSTLYYVWAVADADANTFTVKISVSGTAPTGCTYFQKIGYFYNDASGNILYVSNIKNGTLGNIVCLSGTSNITSSSTTYSDMADMTVFKFVTNGGLVKATFTAPIDQSSGSGMIALSINSTSRGGSSVQIDNHSEHPYGGKFYSIQWAEYLSAGEYEIKVQWKAFSGYTIKQYGSGSTSDSYSTGPRVLIVEEI